MVFPIRFPAGDDRPPDERVAELTEHLAELRIRIVRSCIYLGIGMVAVYFFVNPLEAAIMHPILHNSRVTFAYRQFTEPFLLILQISVVGGLIAAIPFVLGELWGFIRPALTQSERKAVSFVGPMSVVLFILGLTVAYLIMPMAVRWFLTFLPPGTMLMQDPLNFVVFVIKLLLVFGLLFELPVLLMFFGKIGIINSRLMKKYWRQCAVGLFTVAMVVAPSNDPGTMLALAVPLTILFLGSIWLVQLVEPKNDSGGSA